MGGTKPSSPPASRRDADARRAAIQAQQALRRQELAEIETLKRQALARDPDGLNRSALGIDGVPLQAFADVEHKTVHEKGKPVTFARRRPDIVWVRLSEHLGALAHSGEHLTEIYAEMMGLAGAADKDPGMPTTRRDDPTNLPDRMLKAARVWSRIMAEFSPGSCWPALFHGLCQDIMETESSAVTVVRSDGAALTRTTVYRQPGAPHKSRWRSIVAATCREDNRNAQATCVRLACIELAAIMVKLAV